MAKFRVTSPDGRTFDVDAPDGATQDDAIAYVQKNMGAPADPDSRGMLAKAHDFMSGLTGAADQGLSFGLADEAGAGIQAATGSLFDLARGEAPNLSGRYDEALARKRGEQKAFDEAHPGLSGAANIAGGLANPASRLAPSAAQTIAGRIGQGALTGGGYGGAYGFGSGEGGGGNRLTSAAEGAALGGGLGAIAAPVVEGVVAGGRNLSQPILDRLGPADGASRRIAKALERDGMTPDQIAARLDELGPEASISDAGGANLRGLGEVVAQTPGKGAQAAETLLQGRMEGQGQRLSDAVNQGLSGRDVVASADELRALRSQDARPLYEEAFAGGSTAPLETQLGNAFAAASQASSEAAQRVQAAQRALLQTQARKATTSDVYALNGILGEERQAQAALSQAQKAADEAEATKSGILDRLLQAQGDAASNAPGAVWSPRVQQFLDDPIAKAGLRQGLEVQRLEALAAGRKFDPSELAITGLDDAGDPIVGKVPNLRTLDAVKRGLDDILEQYRDKVSGRLVLDQRGRAVEGVRKALVSELDGLTGGAEGAYAQARNAWGGPSQAMDSMARGKGFANADPRVLAKSVGDMSEGEREFFRAGVADKIKDMISTTRDGADATRRIFGNDRIRQQLQAVFPDEASYNAFAKQIEAEALFARNRNQMLGNSRTSFRDAAREDMGFDPGGAVAHGLMGNFGAAIADAARSGMNYLKRPPQSVVDQLAEALFTPGGQAGNAQSLSALTKQGDAMQLSAQQRNALARILAQGGAIEAGSSSGRRR